MLDPIIALINSIVETIRGPLFLPVLGLAICIVGLVFMLGNHEKARSMGIWVAIGGAVVGGSAKIAQAIQTVAH